MSSLVYACMSHDWYWKITEVIEKLECFTLIPHCNVITVFANLGLNVKNFCCGWQKSKEIFQISFYLFDGLKISHLKTNPTKWLCAQRRLGTHVILLVLSCCGSDVYPFMLSGLFYPFNLGKSIFTQGISVVHFLFLKYFDIKPCLKL